VPPGNGFWVDLYVAPDPVPSAPNQVWDRVSEQGVVWIVPPEALPLDAGETLTLTFCPEPGGVSWYYDAEHSDFMSALDAGTPVYVQVDSADTTTDYGAVLEGHERAGGAYNNVRGAISRAGSGCGTLGLAATAGRQLALPQLDRLPSRPQESR
jgi:hypothetical protein